MHAIESDITAIDATTPRFFSPGMPTNNPTEIGSVNANTIAELYRVRTTYAQNSALANFIGGITKVPTGPGVVGGVNGGEPSLSKFMGD